MKRVILPVVLASVLLVACTEKKGKSESGGVLPIQVAYPEVKDIVLTKQYPGYLTAEKTVDLVARVNGTLQKVAYTPGSHVRQGQVLFVIEPTNYQDNVAQAEAALSTATAQLEYAASNYARMQEAMKTEAVSQIQLQQAKSNVATSEAAVNNARAALNTAHTQLAYCTVRAPFDGTVSRSKLDAGSYLSGASQPITLATIYKDDRLYSYFNIADNQWLLMTMSQGSDSLLRQASVRVGQEGSNVYEAELDYLSPNVDRQSGTVGLRAVLSNPDRKLKSGLYVDITLPYGLQRRAVLVPDASIGTDQLGKYLYVVNDSNVVSYRHITTGQLIGDTLRQVTSGLSPRERYVTKALLKVREGMKIKPVE